ncbi:F-box only protein 16-like [Stylophora pistillata]|uniref:F-box only protein 16-like n=1 Tax=Stylophora pistillata TaxID=50429 RepID=UPI000C041850|nr:F-box only protein 16-like [Stylophora pistillata]
MSVRAVDFSSSAYAKTKSFKAKENVATASRIKRTPEHSPSSVKSSWTPSKQDLNEKLFDERKELVSNWFDRWSDAQRKMVLEILISKCKNSQLQYTFSLIDEKIPITHVDFTRKLPCVITIYIMSYLDPRSLCRCAQVCWFWKYLSELDQIWMPKCFKFGWILPFMPTPFEQGVWKRHYLECVRGLQYVRPKSPPGSPKSIPTERVMLKSQSQGSLYKKTGTGTKKALTAWEAPPWRGPDPHPDDIKRKSFSSGHVGGCRRCHMSTLSSDHSDQHDHLYSSKKGTTSKTTKPRIRSVAGNSVPESEPGGSKLNSQTGRPDWAVQASISPLKASRPPPGSEIKPSAQTLGNARGARDLPAEGLFKIQPWRRPPEYDSD